MPTTRTITCYTLEEVAEKLTITPHQLKDLVEVVDEVEYVHPNMVFQEEAIYKYRGILYLMDRWREGGSLPTSKKLYPVLEE